MFPEPALATAHTIKALTEVERPARLLRCDPSAMI